MEKKNEFLNNDDYEPTDNIIHIRIKQRNGRKKWTFIEGLDENVNFKKVVKYLSKKLACGGSVKTDDEGNKYIQFQGEHTEFIKKFLIDKDIIESENISTHG